MSKMSSREISNTDDVIDSRDVIARIGELEADAADGLLAEDEAGELRELKTLAEEGERATADWHHGEALIRDSYFEDYARELAEDLGLLQRGASWPYDHIDWEAAAEALKQDYSAIDFAGVEYWVRA